MEMGELFLIHRKFVQDDIADVEAEVRYRIGKSKVCDRIKPGDEVAVTAGSRGIVHIPEILRTVVSVFRERGALPFIVPAMGSHGGATAEGQLEVLESLGITESTVGAPIRSSMDVVELGRTQYGCPVFMDRFAAEAAAVFIVNRIKVHTRFKADHESGLMKMIAVGLGKRKGCGEMHRYGLYPAIVDAARIAMSKAPVIGGLGIVENASNGIARIGAARAGDLERLDSELLVLEKKIFPGLPLDEIDLLIVDEMGKNISGTGMDTNVIGRVGKPCMNEEEKPRIRKIVVLDLNDASHGNALGMGLADIATERFRKKIDFKATYENVIAANILERAKLPVVVSSDRDAVSLGLSLVTGPLCPEPRVIYIENTSSLSKILVSRKTLEEMKIQGFEDPDIRKVELHFAENGDLVRKGLFE